MVIFNRRSGRLSSVREAADDRHFYGHGVFSSDGRFFYTTENDYENERGILGVWDVGAGWQRLGEIETGGIGPHDIALLPNGAGVVVANGGILTHPETGRTKLNLHDMDPSVAVIDPVSRESVWSGRLSPSLRKCSIRHLDVSRDGRLGFGLQYEGPAQDDVPLIGFVTSSGEMALLSSPMDRQFQHYCADVAFLGTTATLVGSFARGGQLGFWSIEERRFLGHRKAQDCAGLAGDAATQTVWSSTGEGIISSIDPALSTKATLSFDVAWDNHLSLVEA